MTVASDRPGLTEPDDQERTDIPIVRSVLTMVMEGLTQFVESGRTAVLDLRAVSRMDAATYRHLKDALGTGEVSARVEAELSVEVKETRYPGVWWLTHRNERGGIVTELIEITELPGILKSHTADIRAGRRRLEQVLAEASSQEGTEAIDPAVLGHRPAGHNLDGLRHA